MAEHKGGDRIIPPEVRRLYERACRANQWAKCGRLRRAGLRRIYFSLKTRCLLEAIWRSFPDWRSSFEVSLDYRQGGIYILPSWCSENGGLHIPVADLEKTLDYLAMRDEFMYLDLREVFQEVLIFTEKERYEQDCLEMERMMRQPSAQVRQKSPRQGQKSAQARRR